MANQTLFQSFVGQLLPKAKTHNEAGGPAYGFSPKHALAQYAVTGCLNATFYATAEMQLAKVLQFASEVDAEFVAKSAIYCRTRGYMKDTPARGATALRRCRSGRNSAPATRAPASSAWMCSLMAQRRRSSGRTS